MSTASVIEWGRERARTGSWRGDRRVAFLTPVADGPLPTADFVRRCLARLAADGYEKVVTGALSPSEQAGFLAAGFVVEEDLYLLSRSLDDLPTPSPTARRRATDSDMEAILAIDHASFPPFWRLDRGGIREAVEATPKARFEVAISKGEVIGYAITGRAGRRAYVQRLAVHPDARGRGVGAALVVDGLRWARRWRATTAVVNTQLTNEKALALYERLGFRRQPNGLSVLSATVR